MATRTAGLKVVLDGEKEYKQAISELNKGNQVLASEMRKLQEEYKGNEDSVEALTKKSDLLQRQLSQQNDKVSTLRGALERAAKEYGEADKRTQEWQIQLNNAEREQIRLQRELEETNKDINSQGDAFEDEGKKIGGLGDQIDGIAGKLGISLPDSAKDALNSMDGFSVGTVAAMGAVAAGVAVAVKAFNALNDLTKEAAARVDELNTRSAQTGLSTQLLQQLDYAQRFIDFDGIDQSLVKLTTSMDKARDGTEKQAQAFQTLGVSVTDADGQLLDNWETFKKVIDALGEVENAAERDALANDLFGKSYNELKPLIDAGTDALQAYMDAAVENGYVMEEDQIAKLQAVDDAVQENEARWEALKNKIAAEWAPVTIAAMDLAVSAAEGAASMVEESGLKASFDHLVESASNLLGEGKELFDIELPAWANPVNAFAGVLDGFANTLDNVRTALEYVSWAAQTAWEWLSQMPASEVENDVGYYGGYNPALVDWNAAGTESWRGGLTWVGEEGPELVALPRGSRIWSNPESEQIAAASTDTSRMEALLERNVELLRDIYNGIRDQRTIRRMA